MRRDPSSSPVAPMARHRVPAPSSRKGVVGRQCHYLFTSLGEERIGGYYQRAGMQAVKGSESGVDFVFAPGPEDKELYRFSCAASCIV